MQLLNEGTDCWRPVNAKEGDGGVFEILGIMPAGEEWQFAPGKLVRCRPSASGRDDPFANACQTGTVKSQHRNPPMGNAGK